MLRKSYTIEGEKEKKVMIFIESRLTQESSCLAEILVERSTLSRIGLLRAYKNCLF